jgi:hypothetical protein
MNDNHAVSYMSVEGSRRKIGSISRRTSDNSASSMLDHLDAIAAEFL